MFDASDRPAPDECKRVALSTIATLADERDHAFDGIEGWTGTYRDFLTFHLNNTTRRCGVAPPIEEIETSLPERASAIVLDRWLMDWEERRQPTCGPEGGEHLTWYFHPNGFLDRPRIVFTRAERGPLTLAYHGFFGYWPTDEFGAHRTLASLIAVVSYWEERYGALLVANWGTMLEFVVERPPRTLQDAWDLAYQQDLIAPDTCAPRGLAIRAHARALIDRNQWFLHSRP